MLAYVDKLGNLMPCFSRKTTDGISHLWFFSCTHLSCAYSVTCIYLCSTDTSSM